MTSPSFLTYYFIGHDLSLLKVKFPLFRKGRGLSGVFFAAHFLYIHIPSWFLTFKANQSSIKRDTFVLINERISSRNPWHFFMP